MDNITVRTFALLLAVSGSALAPAVFAQQGSVVNAADLVSQTVSLASFWFTPSYYIPPQTPIQLAPRSLAVISYNAFPRSVAASAVATVSLRPVGSAALLPAQVIRTDFTQIAFVVPPDAQPGAAQLIYSVSGVSGWIEVAIVPTRFAFFRNSDPGPPLAQQFSDKGTITLNGLSAPAKQGQAIVLWGVGLGATPAKDIAVTLGGVPQTILFVGPSPSLPGIDQINIRVSAGTPEGCYVPLVLTYGKNTATSFLSTSQDGLACRHPFSLTDRDLQALDGGATIYAGTIDMTSNLVIATGEHASLQESAGVSFASVNASQVAGAFVPAASPTGCAVPLSAGFSLSLLLSPNDPPLTPASFGTMTLTNGRTSLPLISSPVITSQVSGLSALSYSAAIPAPTDVSLGSLPAPSLPAGQWTWSSSGGDLPPSSLSFAVPESIHIASSVPRTLTRTQDETITWNGAAFDAKTQLNLTLAGPAGTLLTCFAPASAGSLTIPKNLLAGLDPVSATLTARVAGTSPGNTARITLGNGTSLVMVASPSSSDTFPVDIQ
jgi:uncharacterized protein (TIGR03437 family)